MGKAEEMAAALKLKQEQEQDGEAKLKAVMDAWPQQIDELLTTVEKWLTPLVEAGLSVTRDDIVKSELDFTYRTQKLTIRSGGRTAVLEPYACFMIGTGGRVDYRLGGHEIGIIYPSDGSSNWQAIVLASSPVPFDEDFFLDRLAKFLGI